MRTGEIALEQGDAGLAILTVKGEHDLNTAAELRSQVEEAIGRASPVMIDLSPAAFIDSSILGAILEGRRQAGEAGVSFVVMMEGGADAVARVLEITGLREELPVHSSREQALAAVGAEG